MARSVSRLIGPDTLVVNYLRPGYKSLCFKSRDAWSFANEGDVVALKTGSMSGPAAIGSSVRWRPCRLSLALLGSTLTLDTMMPTNSRPSPPWALGAASSRKNSCGHGSVPIRWRLCPHWAAHHDGRQLMHGHFSNVRRRSSPAPCRKVNEQISRVEGQLGPCSGVTALAVMGGLPFATVGAFNLRCLAALFYAGTSPNREAPLA